MFGAASELRLVEPRCSAFARSSFPRRRHFSAVRFFDIVTASESDGESRNCKKYRGTFAFLGMLQLSLVFLLYGVQFILIFLANRL